MNEQFFKNLRLKYYQEKNAQLQPRDIDGLIHASSLGGCTKKLWYKVTYAEVRKNISPELYDTFNHGHAVHDWRQGMYKEVLKNNPKYTFLDELKTSDQKYGGGIDPMIVGSTDGLLIDNETGLRYIYELKTMAEKSWDRLRSPQQKHILQGNIYAKAFGAEGVLFEYYNKNKDKSKEYYVEFDPGAIDAAMSQLNYVFSHLEKGEEPRPDPSYFECKSCPYYHLCRPEDS